MLLFIVFSLALCFIVQMASSLQGLLIAPFVIYIGIFLAIVSVLGIVFKKSSVTIWHDLFSSSTLLAWFVYWHSLFHDDAPFFFFFPLYFVFLATFIEMMALGQKQPIDNRSLQQMQAFANNNMVQPWVIMLGVLVSLQLPQHFLLYPVMMTLLMIRFALSRYLNRSEPLLK